MNIVILGGGTAGLIAGLIIREKYPFYDITIVKSSEMGIIGVGEGSTEHWATFCQFVGIDIKDLIIKTDATIKIGIRFTNWNGDNKSYIHSVDNFSEISSLQRHDVYNYLLSNQDSRDSEYNLNSDFKEVYLENKIPIDQNIFCSNQYHFDTFKLNEFLLEKCIQRSINIIDTTILNAILREDGSIKSLETSSDDITGDFFIDCSGFKRFLANKLEQKWVSFKKFLPLDSAIVFPSEHCGDSYEPYTQATALKNGWLWRIPTQKRYGNGYVFSSNYCNTENACEEVSDFYRLSNQKFREIKFEGVS